MALTDHKVWQVDPVVTLVGVVVGQESTVDKLPAKSIRDDDDYSFDLLSLGWFDDVGIEIV
jgi:hypothetical protein